MPHFAPAFPYNGSHLALSLFHRDCSQTKTLVSSLGGGKESCRGVKISLGGGKGCCRSNLMADLQH